MFYNNTLCDIYIGKSAGKKLLEDIHQAKKSITIVSPYLSHSLIKELVKAYHRNIEILLVTTTDSIGGFYNSYDDVVHKLIIQNRKTDNEAVEKREKWKDLIKVLSYILAAFIATLLAVIYFYPDERATFGLIPIITLLLIMNLYYKKTKYMRIYTYSYSQLFPFKLFYPPQKPHYQGLYIHSKMYLIDDEVAYLGSLNFTSKGTKYNHETRVRIKDTNVIHEIKKEIHQLTYNSLLPEKDVQAWGSRLYLEPIN